MKNKKQYEHFGYRSNKTYPETVILLFKKKIVSGRNVFFTPSITKGIIAEHKTPLSNTILSITQQVKHHKADPLKA